MRKTRCSLFVLLTLAFLCAAPVHAADADPRDLLRHPTLMAGDYDGYVSHCLDFVSAHPDAPEAELALRLANYYAGTLKTRRPLTVRLSSMVEAGHLKGAPGGIARLFLAGLLREEGRWEEARAQAERIGQVRDWLGGAGPLQGSGKVASVAGLSDPRSARGDRLLGLASSAARGRLRAGAGRIDDGA
ncbi:MAG: hypothetical protein HYY93_03920 [Planctomycetes bacterium]|nr:hypothetical protein [Planctomycetota bacterium]